MRSKNRIIFFGLAFFCVLLSFSQDITIDGGTVKCPAPLAAGYTKPIGPKTYHVVDLASLQSVINTGSYDVGAGTVTPTDLSCVCTTQITNMSSLFSGKQSFNDDISNWDVSNVTNMNNMFNNARIFDQNISSWDVSSVTTMQSMFENARAFNQNIDVWDVSSVTNMSSMFYNAFQFNQPIASAPNRWNVSNVSNFYAFLRGANSFNHPVEWGGADGTVRATSMWGMFRSNSLNSPITLNTDNVINMQTMFEGASIFNSPLNFSNTSNVKRMSWMFKNAVKFNQPLNFNTSSVLDMKQTFYNARDFNQNINNWDVGSVTNFESIFRSAEDFNQPLNNWNINTGSNVNMKQMFMSSDFNKDISSWDVSKVTNMQETFKSTPFDQDISSWNVSSLKNASSMFRYATAFNQDIGSWNTSSLENTIYMFGNADTFDQDIDGWDVSKVLRFGGMFQNAVNFNQDLNSWVTSSASTMNIMFDGATSFNGNISNWDLSNVNTTEAMFRNAQSFDQDISGWNTSSVNNIKEMFKNADTFNQDIGGWDISDVNSLLSVFNGADKFNQDLNNWNTLGVNNMNSTFKDSGFNHDISNWNTSSVETFHRMFEGASTFNQNLNSWNTSNALSMDGMFYRASDFDGDISSWDVSKVTNMKNLFLRAFSFNQDIGGWDISSVSEMDRMFEDATVFNQDIGPWRVNISNRDNMRQMFLRASAFDHDISEWCVENIATEPNSFKVGSLLTDSTDPQWGVYVIRCDVTPPTVLTMLDSDSDNLLVETDVVQITVTFDEPMMDFPQYSIDGSNYQNLSKTTSSVWTYNFDVSTYSGSDGTISFTVSGTDLNYNAYAGSDKIDFIIDRVPPTLTLTDNHPDLLLNLSDSVLVQASFSESMRTPQLTMSPTLIVNDPMSVAGNDSNWTYTLNVSSLAASDGVYTVTLSATDLAGNSYVGTESITYTLDVTTPTVVLYDDDSDNVVTSIDSLTVTATFSESVQLTPTISLGSLVTNAQMSPTSSQDNWTYFFDFSLLSITPGAYPVNVSGADLAGNTYSTIGGLLNGDETSIDTILLDYQLFTPSITVTSVTKIYERDSQFTLTATSTSGGAITFQKVDPSCSFISISGSDVTIIGAGSCQVKVSQAAFGAYRSAEVFININIEKADIVIETSDYEAECGDENFQLTASCSSCNRSDFIFTSLNTNVVSMTGTNTALISNSGDSVIQVTLPEDGNYNSATATFSLKVSKGDPIVTQDDLTKNYGESFTLTTSSTSDANLIYTITDTGIATVSGSVVTTKGAGSTTILVNQLENQCYNSIITSMTLDVNTVSQTVSWMTDIYKTFGDELTLDRPITDSDYVGIISFSSSDPSIATVNSVTGEVIIENVGAGSVVLTAHLAADNNFDSATVTTSLFIDKSNQSIIVGTIPITKPLKDFSVFPISAVASPSGAPVYIELDPGSAATLSGTVGNYELVSINSTGLVTITFKTIAADHPNYNPASTVFLMDVIKSNQNITIDPALNYVLYYSENFTYTISATSDSGLPIDYNYVSGGVVVTGNKLEINDIGEIIVDIKQPGNTAFNMAPTRRIIINVLQGVTVLSNFNLPDKVFNDDDFTLIEPLSNRPGNIFYTSSNPTVGEVINGKIVINGVGSTKITAIQPANRLYTQGMISTVFFVGDTDLDSDGIGDSYDNCPGFANPDQLDTDGDSLGNLCDLDDDNDNWTDEIEGVCGSDPLDIDSYPSDNDYDGKADCIDLDDDNDGWSDQEEVVCNSDPFDPNITPLDTDLDGISDCEDTDDDNDGWLDKEELNCDSDPLDSAIKPLDTDNDGISNCDDKDDDNDGWMDEEEINCGSDPLNETLYPIDTDNDGISNCYDEDDDGDAWSDEIEEKCETNPLDVFDVPVDRDNDGDPSCTDPDDNQIFVSPLLTPGVNGPESTWKIINFEQYPSSIVKIYNRYGQVVFRKVNYQNDWTGTYNKTGELLPAGSYYYVVEVPETGKVKKGWLYLTY
jgi:gliding motility-associated-like protein